MRAPDRPHPGASTWRGPWPGPVVAVVVAAAYLLGAELAWGWFGASLGLPFFPPAGVTVAVLLWQGRRRWPWVVGAVLAVEWLVDVQHGLGPWVSLGYALANAVEPVAGAWAVRRLGRRGWWRGPATPDLSTRAGLARFLVGAVGVGPLAGALIGGLVKRWASGTGVGANVVHWWVGDGLGVLVVGGALLVLVVNGLPATWPRRVELAGLLATFAVACVLVLWSFDDPVDYLLLPVVWWAAFRFGTLGVAGAGLVLAGVANVATASGRGPFSATDVPSDAARLALTQLYVAVNVLVPWLFAVESAARAVAEERGRRAAADRERAVLDRDVSTLAAGLAGATDPGDVARRLGAAVRDRLGADAVTLLTRAWPGADEVVVGGAGPAAAAPGDPSDGFAVPLAVAAGEGRLVVRRAGGGAPSEDERRYLASVAPLAAEALERSRLLAAERDRSQRLRAVFESIDQGFCVCEMVVDAAGAPVDYRFVEVNPRFEDMTGLVDPVGRTAREMVPDLEPVWVATYARAAFGGEVLRFEQGSEAMGRWFEVFAMPVEPRGQFALVFRDQTARRREEAEARRRQRRAELVAEVLSELERVADPDEQLERLLALLVPALGDEAVFDVVDGDRPTRAATPSPRRLVVPFRAGGDRHGALVVHRRHPSHDEVDAEDVATLQEIADRAEVVMASARLRREEHRISVRLQRALLPERLVWHPNVVVEARYHAAGALLQVGGDWYDSFSWPGGRLAVMVGDVVGHNLDSAATMGRLRAATAALARGTRASPAALLEALERCANAPDGTDFVTAACVVVDTATGRLTYSSAGHPPALLVAPDGTVRRLSDAQTPPIGVAGRRPWREASVVMEPGSVVLLYSDGLIERRREAVDVGLDRLERHAASLVGLPVAELADRLVAEAGRVGPFEDDVVVACFRFTPSVAAFHRVLPAHTGALSAVRAELRGWLDGRGVMGERRDDVLLAVAEAATNAVEHAYPGGTGDVDVSVSDHVHHLTVEVRDRGAWRHVRGRDRAGGRGTAIMRALSSHFERASDDEGTLVRLVVPCAERTVAVRA